MSNPIRFRSPADEPLYVGSTNGQCVRIGSAWREVPLALRADAIAAGAITSNMDAETVAEQVASPAQEDAFDGRAQLVRDAIIRMLVADEPDSFTKSGLPDLRRLSGAVGFNVDREQMQAVWHAMEAEGATTLQAHAPA